jgi:prepilin-type N-terminal cleavage/methylation domain-containing protein/prepilin-type processing-associated H-X9-DG protein
MNVPHLPLRARRAGFTLIELLIVIAIIAVLAAISIPAVMKARESANRITCVNNLRQMGIACYAYTQELGYFPTAGTSDLAIPSFPYNAAKGTYGQTPVQGWQQDAGWGYQLLPYMGLDGVWAGNGGTTFDPVVAVPPIMKTPIKFFFCPSRRSPSAVSPTWSAPAGYPFDPNNAGYALKTWPTTWTWSQSDYAGCNGNNLPWSQYPTAAAANGDGIILSQAVGKVSGGTLSFTVQRNVVRPTDVTDGLAYTLLLAEKAADPLGAGFSIQNEDDLGFTSGYSQGNLNTIRFTNPTLLPLRDPDLTNKATGLPTASNGAFGSIHPGTFNALMADGAVVSLSYQISPTVYAAIGTRAGRTQPVSDVDLLP